MIRLLKLSVNYNDALSSEEILFIHLGYCQTYGKVSFGTNLAIADKPDYVLLVLGNIDIDVADVCYLCHVSKQPNLDYRQYSPDRFKNENCKTWFIFDSMQKIPVEFLDQLLPDNSVRTFIKSRANNKTL